MWAFMDAITDKPEWTRKVFDDVIVGKWYRELRERLGSEPTEGEFWNKMDWEAPTCNEGEELVDWKTDRDSRPSAEVQALPFPWNRGFSDKMFAWCVRELRDKARIAEETGIVSALESSAAAFKSDSAIPADLKEKLRAQAARLEDVPAKDKDWHPGSNDQVLDLVHPSLFPLVYGRSRGFTDRVIASPEAALELIGAGQVIGEPYRKKSREELKAALLKSTRNPEDQANPTVAWRWFNEKLDRIEKGQEQLPGSSERKHLSQQFQWLPAEVDLEYAGGETHVKWASYINNLHPVEYKKLYDVCGGVLARVLPMLDAAYERVMSWDWDKEPRKRIEAMRTVRECTTPVACDRYCDSGNMPRGEEDDSDDDDYFWERQEEWYNTTHPIEHPNPALASYSFPGVSSFKTSEFFGGAKRLQVIVKMANIHLTPENPTYGGGSWHLEGLHNERICATALYYYDVENISESRLALRTNANGEGDEGLTVEFQYDQGDHAGPQQYFDIDTDWDAGAIMDHGSLLAREDRVLVFPNTYQHRVEPFELTDKSKPGHRKILAFFLVDPATPVVSTQNVPPQQAQWGHAGRNALEDRLPEELVRQVMGDVDCPYDLDTAKKIRLDFMDERSAKVDASNEVLKTIGGWSFCEH